MNNRLGKHVMAILIVLLLIPAIGFAAGGGWQKGEAMGSGTRWVRMAKALDLSEGQKTEIRTILQAEREKIAPLRQQLRESSRQLRQTTLQTPFDEAAVRTLAASRAEAAAELTIARARMQNQIHAVLTPEQRQKAQQAWQQKARGQNRCFSPGRGA